MDQASPSSTEATVVEPVGNDVDLEDPNWWRIDRTPASRLDLQTHFSESYASSSADPILAGGEVIVHGIVQSVEGPFWKSADGQFVELNYAGGDLAMYREIELGVITVYWDDHGMQPRETLRLIAPGGGEEVITDERGRKGAYFDPGDEVIVVLDWLSTGFAEGSVEALTLRWGPNAVLVRDADSGNFVQQISGAPIPVTEALIGDRFPDGVPLDDVEALLAELKAVPEVAGGSRFWNPFALGTPPESPDYSLSPVGE